MKQISTDISENDYKNYDESEAAFDEIISNDIDIEIETIVDPVTEKDCIKNQRFKRCCSCESINIKNQCGQCKGYFSLNVKLNLMQKVCFNFSKIIILRITLVIPHMSKEECKKKHYLKNIYIRVQ